MDKKTSSIREVDIHEYLPVLIEILNTGKDVSLLISGNSMSPFLVHQRDTIIISPKTEPLYKGEMVFFIRSNGQYVMHRIHHIDQNGQLFIVGDAQDWIEGPIKQEQVFGVVHKAFRKGKLIQKGDFWYDFFEKVWIRVVPLRSIIKKGYSILHKLFTLGRA